MRACVFFFIIIILKGAMTFQSQSPCISLSKNTYFNNNEAESKMENYTHSLREASHNKNRKSKLSCLELEKEKNGHFLYYLFCPNEIFLIFVLHLKV